MTPFILVLAGLGLFAATRRRRRSGAGPGLQPTGVPLYRLSATLSVGPEGISRAEFSTVHAPEHMPPVELVNDGQAVVIPTAELPVDVLVSVPHDYRPINAAVPMEKIVSGAPGQTRDVVFRLRDYAQAVAAGDELLTEHRSARVTISRGEQHGELYIYVVAPEGN